MATVDSDTLNLTLAGLKTNFDLAYKKATETAVWSAIATQIDTTLPVQKYGWLGYHGTMQAYSDRSVEQPINELDNGYSVSDQLYDVLEPVQRRAIEDDQYGLIMLRFTSIGEEAPRHWNQLAFQGLTSGFTSKCSDGQNFFDTGHQEGLSPTQVNKTTNNLSDPALETAITTMMAIQNDKGVPMGIMPDTLVVGPSLLRRATDLLGSKTVVVHVGDGTAGSGALAATPFSNFFDGRLKLIVNHYIYGTAKFYWFVLDTSRTVKPIIMQNRMDVPITIESDMTSPQALMQEQWKVRLRGRYAQAYGLWQLAYGGAGTA